MPSPVIRMKSRQSFFLIKQKNIIFLFISLKYLFSLQKIREGSIPRRYVYLGDILIEQPIRNKKICTVDSFVGTSRLREDLKNLKLQTVIQFSQALTVT